MDFNESERLFEEAKKISPGGVTSERQPTKFIPGKYPIFIKNGKIKTLCLNQIMP